MGFQWKIIVTTLAMVACSRAGFEGKKMIGTQEPLVPQPVGADQKPVVVVANLPEPTQTPLEGSDVPPQIISSGVPIVAVSEVPSVTPLPPVVSVTSVPTATSTPLLTTSPSTALPVPTTTAVPTVSPLLTLDSCDNVALSVQSTNVQCSNNQVAVGMGVVNRDAPIDALKCCSVKFSNGAVATRNTCNEIPLAHAGATAFCSQDQFFVGFKTNQSGHPYVGICCQLSGPENYTVKWNSVVTNPNPEPLNPNYWPGQVSYDTFGVVARRGVISPTCPDGVMSGAGDQFQPDMSFDQIRCHTLKAVKDNSGQ